MAREVRVALSGSARGGILAERIQGCKPLVRGFEYGRGNADAAVDLINDGGTALRSSDHDGQVLRIFADSDGDGVADADDACPGTVVPEGVPTVALGVNRYALTDGDRTFDTVAQHGRRPGDVFTLDDTRGCSCEQVVAARNWVRATPSSAAAWA